MCRLIAIDHDIDFVASSEMFCYCQLLRPTCHPQKRPYPAGIPPVGSAYPAYRPLVQGVSGKISSGPGIYAYPIKIPPENRF